MAYRIRYEGKSWPGKAETGKWKGQLFCSLVLFGAMVLGAQGSSQMKEHLQNVFLPEESSVAVGYASGESLRQIFIDYCRAQLREALADE